MRLSIFVLYLAIALGHTGLLASDTKSSEPTNGIVEVSLDASTICLPSETCTNGSTNVSFTISGGTAPYSVAFSLDITGGGIQTFTLPNTGADIELSICHNESHQGIPLNGSVLFIDNSDMPGTASTLKVPSILFPATLTLLNVEDAAGCAASVINNGPVLLSVSGADGSFSAAIDAIVCDTLFLPEISPATSEVAYYTEAEGQGRRYMPGDTITYTDAQLFPSILDSLFIFDQTISAICGETLREFTIAQSPVHPPRQDTVLCSMAFELPPFPTGPLVTDKSTYASSRNFEPSSILEVGNLINTSQQIYIADTIGDACTFLDSFMVTILEEPFAGIDSTIIVCAGTPFIIQDPRTYLSDPDAGGIWQGTMIPGLDFNNPMNIDLGDLPAGIIYSLSYTIEQPDCGLFTSNLTMVISDPPFAGRDTTINICQAEGIQDLPNLLGNPQNGGFWNQILGNPVDLSDPTAVDFSSVPLRDYQFRYEVLGTIFCDSQTATLTINLNSGPNAGADNTAIVCSGDSLDVRTLTSIDANTGGSYIVDGFFPVFDFIWPSGSILFGAEEDSKTVEIEYILDSPSPNCPADTAVYTITVLKEPNAGIPMANPIELCGGEEVDLFELLTGETSVGQFYELPLFMPISSDWIVNNTDTQIAYITESAGACLPDSSILNINAIPMAVVDFSLSATALCQSEEDCVTGTFSFNKEVAIDLRIADADTADEFSYTREVFDNILITICPQNNFGDQSNDTLYIGEASNVEFTITSISDPLSNCANGTILANPVELTINPTYDLTRTGTVCMDETTLIDGVAYGSSTDLFLQSVAGCDSIIHIVIDTIAQDTGRITRFFCTGDMPMINGQVFDSDLVDELVTFTGAGAEGCDSIALVNLTFDQKTTGVRDTMVCFGSSVMIGGSVLDVEDASIEIDEVEMSIAGCDSSTIYTLRYFEQSQFTLDTMICAGQTFTKGIDTYSENNLSGTSLLLGQSINGCDSLLMINVTLTDNVEVDTTLFLCQDETIIFNGTVYGDALLSGQELLPALIGCDTLLTFTIEKIQSQFIEVDDNICSGSALTINGVIYDENNLTGRDTLQSINGCDSIIYNINLNLNEVSTSVSELTDCDGVSSILLEVDAGLEFPLAVSIDGVLVETVNQTPVIINTTVGTHEILLDDGNCLWNETIDITGNFTNGLDITVVDIADNTYDLSFTSDLIPATIEWTPAEILDCNNCTGVTAVTTAETEITLLVTDENGCTATAEALLPYTAVIPENEVFIYEPNAIDATDRANNTFFIQSNLVTQIYELRIYDRWGNLSFTNRDFFSNDATEGWNTSGSGTEQGVYVYLIRYFDGIDREVIKRGSITVLR